MEGKFKKLFEPIQVGPLLLKNRMVMSPMWTRLCSAEGDITQQELDYFTARAKNGVAAIITGGIAVDNRHAWIERQVRIDDDRFLPGLYRLAYAAHINGVPIILQLHHAGMYGKDPISPSGVGCWMMGHIEYIEPKTMTLEEIEETRDMFIAGAVRAKAVGFDGVELHGSCAYLLEQFFSPYQNKRTDKYGGSLEKRMTLALEIVRGIRGKCGSDFVVGYGLVADDLLPGGIEIDGAIALTKALEQEGVNYVTVMEGTYESFGYTQFRGGTTRQGLGCWNLSEKFKKEIKTAKVIVRSFGDHDPLRLEEALEKEWCDIIYLGRALLCDPEFCKKVAEGRLDDIRRCTRCNYCQEVGIMGKGQVVCAQNPEVGRERDYAITPTTTPKRVLVVGGGPGGLEAARVAALRGHEVTLMEKEAQLGGNLRIASLPIGKEDYQSYVGDWRERQCRKAGVKIELSKEVTPEVVREVKPDAVIVAIGATPIIPEIPGVTKPHVVMAVDVLTGRARVGKKVVVAGGGLVGAETADFIAEKGVAESITVLEMLPEIIPDMEPVAGLYLLAMLEKYGVKIVTNTHILEITDKTVVAIDTEFKKHNFEADTVVLAVGYTPNRTLYDSLREQVPELYAIGDCVKARKMPDAIHEGAYVARQI